MQLLHGGSETNVLGMQLNGWVLALHVRSLGFNTQYHTNMGILAYSHNTVLCRLETGGCCEFQASLNYIE